MTQPIPKTMTIPLSAATYYSWFDCCMFISRKVGSCTIPCVQCCAIQRCCCPRTELPFCSKNIAEDTLIRSKRIAALTKLKVPKEDGNSSSLRVPPGGYGFSVLYLIVSFRFASGTLALDCEHILTSNNGKGRGRDVLQAFGE